MKKTIIVSVAALALVLGACNNSSNMSEQSNKTDTTETFYIDTTKLKSGETFYQCEMNPEVILDSPGNCPKCGMKLSKMKKK